MFENRVKHIIFGEFSDGQEFEPIRVLKILLFTYKTKCGFEELVTILDKLADDGKLVCPVPGRKYKIKTAHHTK